MYVSGDTDTVLEGGMEVDTAAGMDGDIEEPEELPGTYADAEAEGE